MLLEQTILTNLIHDEVYFTDVMPYMKPEYFDNFSNRKIFEAIEKFYGEYKRPPTKEILEIALEKRSDLNEKSYADTVAELKKLEPPNALTEKRWLMDETEDFCKRRDLYNSLKRSVAVFEGSDKSIDIGALPKLLSDSLSISFDPNVGHDYTEDYEKRYDFYNSTEEKIQFDIDLLNEITKGGLSRKSLTCYIAGCVTVDTPIDVRISAKGENDWSDFNIKIGEIADIIHTHNIKVSSPDGWVDVDAYVEKGKKPLFCMKVNGKKVRCSNDHLFETLEHGWLKAEDFMNRSLTVLTENGWMPSFCYPLGVEEEVVDITVIHENHRYYTNGVSSHNTGAGKTMVMCHNAAHFLLSGMNVLYITLEMAEERISERIDANILDVTLDDLKQMSKNEYLSRMSRIRDKVKSKLIIKEYPTGSANAAHFRHLLNELRDKKDFVPDVLIIDYINLCTSYRVKDQKANSYTIVKSVAEEIRGLCMEWNIAGITATQSNRGAVGASDIDLGDVSECVAVGEKVITRCGKEKNIEDLVPGDQILSNDGYKTVVFVHHKKPKQCHKIITANGKTITVSEDHIFPTSAGRVSIKTGLSVGTKISSK